MRRCVMAGLAAVALACAAPTDKGRGGGGGNGGGAGGAGGGVLPSFGHVFTVVEENHDLAQVDSTSMPYLWSLMTRYGMATQYYANTHPSIGNYFMMTAGKIVTNSDSYSATVTDDNIVRHLLAAGKTWKSYAEDQPSVGYTGQKTGLYARKHNPLSFYSDVVDDSGQIKRLVPFTPFATDLRETHCRTTRSSCPTCATTRTIATCRQPTPGSRRISPR